MVKLADIFERVSHISSSFVKTLIYDNYDDVVESKTFERLLHVLNAAFQSHDITFKFSIFPHGLSAKFVKANIGIIEGTTTPNGEIVISVVPEFFSITEDDARFDKAISILTPIIQHELAHREQGVRSYAKSFTQHMPSRLQKIGDEWTQYLSDPHEVYAMAHEIVEQFKQHNLTTEQILASLRLRVPTLLIRNSRRFEVMFTEFRDKDPTGALSRVKKQIYRIVSS